jgi:hypothetical protein
LHFCGGFRDFIRRRVAEEGRGLGVALKWGSRKRSLSEVDEFLQVKGIFILKLKIMKI